MIDSEILKNELDVARLFMTVSVAGLISPVIVIVMQNYLGYTIFLEGLVKTIVVMAFIVAAPVKAKTKLIATVVLGILFGLSETVFYYANMIKIDSFSLLKYRLLITVPMHGITVLLVIIPYIISKRRWTIFIGFTFAYSFHVLFNYLVQGFT